MAPHLVRWHEEMAEKGLVVIAVEDGRAASVDSWRDWVEKRVPHAALYDEAGETSKKFEIRGYPAAYVIGRNGKVIWQGPPRGGVSEVEETIREAVGA
jgi:hypothetical protein